MSLVLVALIAGPIALACIAVIHVLSWCWADRQPEPALEAADQGPRGGHLGWFEGRWARAFQPDVLFAVVVTRDRLLLLCVGGQFSGRQEYGRLRIERVFALEAKRRAKYAEELAVARSPDVLLGRHRRDLTIPVHDIKRATVGARREFGWLGPAKLVIERVGAPAMTLVLEDGWQVAACARALQAVMGEAVGIEPVLAPMLTDTPAAIKTALARRKETVHLAMGVLYGCIAVLVFSILWAQTHPAPVDAHQRSNVMMGAAALGVVAGIAIGEVAMSLWARKRREKQRSGRHHV